MERKATLTTNASMDYTHLKVYKLECGVILQETIKSGFEACVVFLSGSGTLKINNVSYEVKGRNTVFDPVPPNAAYIKQGDSITFSASTDCEVALGQSIATGGIESRFITSDSIHSENRGTAGMLRRATNILPETDDAESILVVEVITRGGNWSSFPSHRHDEDSLPHQSFLEEIYYHKLNPKEGGFALQYVYNDNRTVSETYVIEDSKAVLVHEGYHPVSVPPGYDLYYLNIMAGPKRTWKFHNDPHFEHLLKEDKK